MSPPSGAAWTHCLRIRSLLSLFICLIALAHSKLVTVTVDNENSALQWSPGVCDILPPGTCPGVWWLSRSEIYLSGTVHTTSGGTGCSVELKFRGSAISWYSSKFRGGGTARVSIDSGTPTLVSTEEDRDSTLGRVLVFSQTGLNPNTGHTLKLSWASGGFLDVDYFEISGDDSNPVGPGAGSTPPSSTDDPVNTTPPPPPPPTSSPNPTTTDPTPTGSSSQQSRTLASSLTSGTTSVSVSQTSATLTWSSSSTAATSSSSGSSGNSSNASSDPISTQSLPASSIAGIAVGGIAGLLIIVFGAYCYGRRHNRRGQHDPTGHPVTPFHPEPHAALMQHAQASIQPSMRSTSFYPTMSVSIPGDSTNPSSSASRATPRSQALGPASQASQLSPSDMESPPFAYSQNSAGYPEKAGLASPHRGPISLLNHAATDTNRNSAIDVPPAYQP